MRSARPHPAMAAGLDTVTVPRAPLSTGPVVDVIVGVLPEHSSKVVT
jgi:hypothetical protein